MRRIEQKRTTKETDISLDLGFPSDTAEQGQIQVATGVPFFDHMLTSMLFHGGFDGTIKAIGDIDVDEHHTVEDVGIVLGNAVTDLIKLGAVRRFGHKVIPMDDALAEVTIDLGGRPVLVYKAEYPQARIGTFDASLAREFFQGFVNAASANVHCHVREGHNSHHMVEALFKAFGRALGEATVAASTVRSTKGVL